MDPVVNAFLDALDGVAYLVSREGRIVGVGPTRWNAFAAGGGVERLDAAGLAGRDLFQFVSGAPLQDFYRARHETVLGGGAPSIGFEYRCDAPQIRRAMRMSISCLRLPEAPPMVLYQSQVLSQVHRPWMSLFEPGRVLEALETERRLPVVTMCGICQKLAWPLGRKALGPEWIEAETYYRRGGAADVRISHGVCDTCAATGRQD